MKREEEEEEKEAEPEKQREEEEKEEEERERSMKALTPEKEKIIIGVLLCYHHSQYSFGNTVYETKMLVKQL